MSCWGAHRWGPWRNGRRRCLRPGCGVEDPPQWAWWARATDDTSPTLFDGGVT